MKRSKLSWDQTAMKLHQKHSSNNTSALQHHLEVLAKRPRFCHNVFLLIKIGLSIPTPGRSALLFMLPTPLQRGTQCHSATHSQIPFVDTYIYQ